MLPCIDETLYDAIMRVKGPTITKSGHEVRLEDVYLQRLLHEMYMCGMINLQEAVFFGYKGNE